MPLKNVGSSFYGHNHRSSLTTYTARTFSNSLIKEKAVVTSNSFKYLILKRLASTFVKQKSHYEILNVSKSATTDEIRQAFINLSKIWHPDKNTNDPTRHQMFVQINEAYSILSKPLSRRDYDLSLDAQKYVSRHMNAATSRTYSYGYSPHAGPYYHHRDHVYDEYYWAHDSHHSQPSRFTSIFNFYMLMACATFATVSIILHYMYNYIPNPKHYHLRKDLSCDEIEKHELIMQSEQDGTTVYYYAVPKKGSEKVDIVVLRKSQDAGSSEFKMHEVTRSAK
ncbi:DnaJ-like protein 60 [Elysia marginata]|uniref:DnaJ-like protein 60 n=1 Tax=Elysia marginata TaxID=1093978 RepID=A0AAV4EZX5_9GAST|nr:DnaJ-like protein 60 [Elysia marginata]